MCLHVEADELQRVVEDAIGITLLPLADGLPTAEDLKSLWIASPAAERLGAGRQARNGKRRPLPVDAACI